MNDVELAEVLERAAEILDERGWCQGETQARSGSVCLVGSVNISLKERLNLGSVVWVADTGESNQIREAIAQHLVQSGFTVGRGFENFPLIGMWNDAKDRTQDEVRDALLGTAKELRNTSPAT